MQTQPGRGTSHRGGRRLIQVTNETRFPPFCETISIVPALSSTPVSPWPHRMAVLLVCATFPLIWVGGLVTTFKAGMAFPDWPTSGGYNMLAYPLDEWWHGPFDMFIEHGHRLLAIAVGLITIAAALVFQFREPRRWVRWLAWGALLAVCLQGGIGGLRVVLDHRRVAMIHGCVGPAFFGFTIALAVVTSARWRRSAGVAASPEAAKLRRLSLATAAIAYVQLVLGAAVRHVPETAAIAEFQAAVLFHLIGAAALVAHAAMLIYTVLRRKDLASGLRLATWGLGIALTVQIMLGAGTWVAKYGYPAGLESLADMQGQPFVAGGTWQAGLTTAHMAVGSLILGISVLLAVRACRLLRPISAAATGSLPQKSAASPPLRGKGLAEVAS